MWDILSNGRKRNDINACVAQLVEAVGLSPKCWGFESLHTYQIKIDNIPDEENNMSYHNGYSSELIPCFKCGQQLKNFSNNDHHPLGGLSFETRGHYGSSFFDPMDGSRLAIAICDECLKSISEKNMIYKFNLYS